jgi:isoleucyl-tRNA synthetase
MIQQARKDADFHVSDRIGLWVECGDDVRAAVETHRAYIEAQVLADGGIEFGGGPGDAPSARAKIGGGEVTVRLSRHAGS